MTVKKPIQKIFRVEIDGKKHFFNSRTEMAKHFDKSVSTVANWLKRKRLPNGEKIVTIIKVI